MNCPYCENEMIAGYICCRDGVFWTEEAPLVAALSGFSKNAVSLWDATTDSERAVRAYNCDKCRKVIVDYNPK